MPGASTGRDPAASSSRGPTAATGRPSAREWGESGALRHSLFVDSDRTPLTPDTAGPDRPSGTGTRPYDANPPQHVRPPHRTDDHRHARPNYYYVPQHPHTHYGVHYHHYVPYYSHWYCHPYYRYQHSTVVVVGFGFATYAWYDWWVPPYRAGWSWVPGYWYRGYWYPGYWAPIGPPPSRYVVYVPGHWSGPNYVEGYYRKERRTDGDWQWVDGHYLDDGTFVEGHWRPTEPGPAGYVWEPGFYDGERAVDGFWRPEFRSAYTWVSSYYDADGIRHAGYWLPLDDRSGQVWIPGWFDGHEWVAGYWVAETTFLDADIDGWEPAEGWDAGWEVGNGWGHGEVIENLSALDLDDVPLAVPVVIEEASD